MVGCMNARVDAGKSASAAIQPAKFNARLFDERCEALEAMTEVDKAALIGVDYTTLYRFRKDEHRPRLDVALRIAEMLGVAVEQLWEKP